MKLFNKKHGRYEGRHTSPRRKKARKLKSLLPLCLILILAACLTIGGTLAFMQKKTGTVTNTFKAGEITYTLNLEPNAKDVTMPSDIDAKSSTNLTVNFTLDKAPTKTGYTFGGWYYDAACTEQHTDIPGTSLAVKYGDTHDQNDDANKVEITLYARWSANTYEVAYDGNGATSGNMVNSQHTYDVEKNLTTNAFSRTGYRFLGWSEDQSATTATYTDQQSIVNLGTENGAVVTLYAVWKRMDFTVTFDTQADDVTADPASKTVTYQMLYGDLPTLTRTGYTFGGWTLEKTGGKEITSTSTVGVADDHTLYAQWTPYTYTVKYDNNVDPENTSITQPTGSTSDSPHTYDVPKALTNNGFSRTGYTFIGWNTQADGKGDSYVNGEVVTNLSSDKNGVVTLYAQWGVKSYVLRYNANGGEGTMPDQVVEWDKLTKISENKFTNNTGDYKFAGWSTTPNGEVEYLENQQIVNLQESGTIDLYAVWLRNSYTVTFNYNIGYGTPPTKEVLYDEEYGVLPPYLTTKTENLFKGWYTAPEGGERVYPKTIVNRKENHTLWAHWDPSPANDVIKELVVHNSADDNNDGIVDEMHLEFVCSSSFEKFNVPIKNLVPGQTYTLTYTTSNNASFGDHISGYKNARYGSYIVPTATENAGNLSKDLPCDIIATWNNRIEPDGDNDGSQAASNDTWLNGPWEKRTITFTATASTMYWAWEFGLIQDHIRYDYNIYDISLEPVVPKINFANKQLVIHTSSDAKVKNDNSTAYTNNFVFDGAGYAETMYFPIAGLTAGSTYTITFDHSIKGALINNSSYNYGCGISSVAPTKYGSYMDNVGATWISGTKVFTNLNMVESVTFTFTATGSTAYWVWNMANCSDTNDCTIDVNITNFSAKHNAGGTITYHSAVSNAGATLSLRQEEHSIDLVWDGIDDTAMDAWYPVDEQYPTVGDSYELAFEPSDGFTMAEIITVVIDGVTYEVRTNGQTEEGVVVPVYDPADNVLTIPAELLTEETATVSVSASTVAVDISITTGEEDAPEVTDPKAADESETHEIAVTLNLVNMTAQGNSTLQAGADYKVILTPDEGYELPEIIRVEIDGVLYEVYTDGLEHRTLGAGETELPPMPTFDPATGMLTIPAVLLGEATERVTITVSAVKVNILPDEPENAENTGEEKEDSVDNEATTTDGPETTNDTAVLPPDNKEEEQGDKPDGDDDADDTTDLNEQSGDVSGGDAQTDANEEVAE